MSYFDHLKIWAKIAIVPAVATISMVVIAVVGMVGLANQQRALDEIANVSFAKSVKTGELGSLIQAAHSDLYRMLTWTAAGVDDQRIATVEASFNSLLDQAEATLAAIRADTSLNAEEAALLEDIRAAIGHYRANTAQVLSMQQLDFAAAVSFMWTAQDDFQTLLGEAQEMIALESRLVEENKIAAGKSAAATRAMFIAFNVGAILILAAISLLLTRAISSAVGGMTKAMKRLAEGDLEVEVPAIGRRDEIGAMADAVQVFKDNAVRVKNLTAEQEEMARKADRAKRAAMNDLAAEIEMTVRAAVEAASQAADAIRGEAEVLAANAETAITQTAQVAHSSEAANGNVETVAQAAERLVGSITEINRQVSESSAVAEEAVAEAARTDETVKGLTRASQKIGDVVSLINDIAAQTNLLALNATIEAARAGDAGKGFAVVASEVKNLANQTSRATEEIASEISAMKAATDEAVGAIDGIVATINRVSEALSVISTAVGEQGRATGEISASVSQAADGTRTVTSGIGEVRRVADQVGTAAANVHATTEGLVSEFARLQSEVDGLVAKLKSA